MRVLDDQPAPGGQIWRAVETVAATPRLARLGHAYRAGAERAAAYPTIQSGDENGLPIGWGALSGLAADRAAPGKLFSVTDSAYAPSRILEIDAAQKPVRITGAMTVTRGGKPASYDLEGVATREGGGFWLASEGNPEKKDTPLADILLRVSAKGEVEEEIRLPEALAKHAVRFGFEGVAVTGTGADETVWLAVQREWFWSPLLQPA